MEIQYSQKLWSWAHNFRWPRTPCSSIVSAMRPFPWAVKQTNATTNNRACFLSSSLVSLYQGYQKHGLWVEYDPWKSSVLIQFWAGTKKNNVVKMYLWKIIWKFDWEAIGRIGQKMWYVKINMWIKSCSATVLVLFHVCAPLLFYYFDWIFS